MDRVSCFLYSIHYNFTRNLSCREAVCLFILAVLVWILRKRGSWLAVAYSVFLIAYITLIRRAPEATGILLLQLRSWRNPGELASALLNMLLYLPLGVSGMRFWWTVRWWQREVQQTGEDRRCFRCAGWVLLLSGGTVFSLLCEVIQYRTGRGWADINDVIANVLGMVLGMILGSIHVRQITRFEPE